MNWGLVILLIVVLGGAAWICVKMHSDDSGAFSCIHCGECISAGECVFRKNPRGKSAKKTVPPLDKEPKKDIIILVKEQTR